VSPDPVRDGLQTTLGAAYRLDRELGGGGMSRVFVAEETSLLRLPGGFSKFTMRLDPTFDPVRNSPAFQRLLQ
jgi:hypothetical protein